MKKYFTALLIAAMLFTLVSCANEEISMYSLISEMSKLDKVESTNIISVSLDGDAMAETLDSIPPEMEELRKTLSSGFEIKYMSKLKRAPLEYEVAIELKNKEESEFRKITTIIGNETVTYIKLDDLLKFIKPYVSWHDTIAEKTIDNIIEKVVYIKIDLRELQKRGNNYALSYENGLWSNSSKIDKSVELADEFIETIKTAFKDFSFDAITEKDNGYELVLEPEDLTSIYVRLVKYIINNIDHIASTLTDKFNSMDDAQMGLLSELYGSEIEKDELISGIDDFKEEVKATTPEELEEIENDVYFGEDFKNIEGSHFKYYVGKTDEGNYESTTDLLIHYADGYTSELYANIAITSEMKALDNYSLVVPLNFTTVEELEDIIYSTVPVKANKVKMNLNTKNAGIKYNNGNEKNIEFQYINRDGYNYLPLKTVGESLGEEVVWDDTKKEAYVIVDGERIVMKGIIRDGRTYVKVRDFEKLGYEIDWNENSREVMVERDSRYPYLDYYPSND